LATGLASLADLQQTSSGPTGEGPRGLAINLGKQEKVMPVVIEKTDLDRAPNKIGNYAVRAFNNDVTPYLAVMGVFIISCGYSQKVADKYTMEIHTKGQSVCYWASKEACEAVIKDFKGIGVRAELIEQP
jgi:ATP-dependent Clp protease adapter protein ClpS